MAEQTVTGITPEFYLKFKDSKKFKEDHFPSLVKDGGHHHQHGTGTRPCSDYFIISHESGFYYFWNVFIIVFCTISSLIYAYIAAFGVKPG